MGFNLLAFAGGAAKSITEQIDKQEEEAKVFALNSTKLMHERYTKTLESNRQQLSSIEDDLSTIRSNFPGKFTESQLYNIGISNAQRKQLVEAAKDPNIDKSLLDTSQIVKVIEDNPSRDTAMDRIRQAYALPSVVAAKAADAKESGFFSGFGERAGAVAAKKYAGMTGVSLEQMRGAQDWKAPTSTAEFDLTRLVKDKTLPDQLVSAGAAVAKATKSGDTVALQKAKELFESLSDEKNELDKMLSGDDGYAQDLLNKRAKSILVSSNPNNYTNEEKADANQFLNFERKQAQLHAAAIRAPQGDGTSTSKASSLLDAAIKNATDGFLVKRGDRQTILGTTINAASAEGVAKVRDIEEKAATQLLKVMGVINSDNSIKDNATARIVLSRGLRTYEEGGKLFIGTPAAAPTAGKPATAPPKAIEELALNPSAENKQFFLKTFGYLPEEKLLKQPPAAPPTTGFATRPAYVPPPTSPAGKSQALRAKVEEENVKSLQLKKQAGEKLSSDFSKDVATLSPADLSIKYDAIRGQLSTADKVKLQAKEREIK